MNPFEAVTFSPKKENRSMYPERATEGIDKKIEALKAIMEGREGKIELDEDEKRKLLEFENELGEKLEKIIEIKEETSQIYLEYFLTDEGRKDFKEVTGEDIKGESNEDVAKFIINQRKLLKQVGSKKRSDMEARSLRHYDNILVGKLTDTINEQGDISLENAKNPERIGILLNPENCLEKRKKLIELRMQMKHLLEKIDNQVKKGENYAQAKSVIAQLYKKRINQLLVFQYKSAVDLFRTKELVDENSLKGVEKNLLEMFAGFNNIGANIARYDKLNHGASNNYDMGKNRIQVSDELKEYVSKVEKEYIQNEIGKYAKIKEKMLDSEKIFKKEINVDQFSELAEEELAHYGLLSSDDAESFDPKRIGPASDGNWQFVASDRYGAMGVTGDQKVVKSGVKNKSINETVSVLLGHEIEGHVIQHINNEALSLRLFNEIGGDRSDVFSEAGAMMVQNKITTDAFGYSTIGHPYYIRAMEEKIAGGDYLDCVKAFYESTLKTVRAKKAAGAINQKQFGEEVRGNLKLAVNRAKRLFRNGADFSSKDKFLGASKDTVYLEQMRLVEKLKQAGMGKCVFLKGINLDGLLSLAKVGLVDFGKIKEPDYFSLKIWERMKNNYILEKKA